MQLFSPSINTILTQLYNLHEGPSLTTVVSLPSNPIIISSKATEAPLSLSLYFLLPRFSIQTKSYNNNNNGLSFLGIMRNVIMLAGKTQNEPPV